MGRTITCIVKGHRNNGICAAISIFQRYLHSITLRLCRSLSGSFGFGLGGSFGFGLSGSFRFGLSGSFRFGLLHQIAATHNLEIIHIYATKSAGHIQVNGCYGAFQGFNISFAVAICIAKLIVGLVVCRIQNNLYLGPILRRQCICGRIANLNGIVGNLCKPRSTIVVSLTNFYHSITHGNALNKHQLEAQSQHTGFSEGHRSGAASCAAKLQHHIVTKFYQRRILSLQVIA